MLFSILMKVRSKKRIMKTAIPFGAIMEGQ